MARQFQVLGDRFLAWDTAPPNPAPVSFTWPDDLPVSFQDSEKVLQVEAVAAEIAVTAGTGLVRRVLLSVRTPGNVEVAQVGSAGSIVGVAGTLNRRFEFAVGHVPATALAPGRLLMEQLPAGLVLLPGQRILLDIDNRQVGDRVNGVAMRGRIYRP